MLRRLIAVIVFALLAVPASAATISVVVDISTQEMTVRKDGEVIHTFTVSTGRAGYATPTGSYSVTRLHERYFSQKYDNAPMPYSIFFHGGYAIHGTTDLKNLGRVASHGCVRLDPQNARVLFKLVEKAGWGNTSIRVKA
jgi:lipoprotein-anchoring transpeptidase ErfK/SrfK